ncbi:type II secretion system F family protein [Paraliobacillus sediminis]|uniref:type II secretion system F family protein n=1 Tax=Paraliobacillus sediminis TaxID=1885916 RepID=UPI001F085C40|nr:type II secretion system F family protein [Paraliobacillus sediminis]
MSKIDVILLAVLAVVITVIAFIIYDKKKNKPKETSELTKEKPKPLAETKASMGAIDYNTYVFKKPEYIFISVAAAALLFVIGYIFYQSVITAVIFSALGFYYPKLRKEKLIQKRKDELSRQFQQALFSLSSSLVAGRSIENAFLEVTKDLYLMYPDPNTLIIKEFELINKRIANRESIETAIEDFSNRAAVEDITNFTDVFVTCKRTGGDLVEVIRRTSNMISEKFEIQQEIAVMVAQKKFESNALAVAPLVMIGLLTYSSGDYMAPLYQWSELGPVVMTICLVALGFCFWLCQRIMNIKV